MWPVPNNPRTKDFPKRLREVSDLFNALYGLVYVTMGGLFSGTQDQSMLIGRLYALMSDCLSPTARYLVRQPVDENTNAAPTFEIYRFGDDPWTETARLAETVSGNHPELSEVASKISGTLRMGPDPSG